MREEAGYVLQQGKIHFVVASPLHRDHPDNQRLALHGDGVKDIALEVDQVADAYDATVSRGAVGVTEPTEEQVEVELAKC